MMMAPSANFVSTKKGFGIPPLVAGTPNRDRTTVLTFYENPVGLCCPLSHYNLAPDFKGAGFIGSMRFMGSIGFNREMVSFDSLRVSFFAFSNLGSPPIDSIWLP
jgi:hypothetical protein